MGSDSMKPPAQAAGTPHLTLMYDDNPNIQMHLTARRRVTLHRGCQPSPELVRQAIVSGHRSAHSLLRPTAATYRDQEAGRDTVLRRHPVRLIPTRRQNIYRPLPTGQPF